MIKYIFVILVTQYLLFGAVWSLTMMHVATSGIIPTVKSGMNNIINKQNKINNQYDKVLKEINVTNKYTTQNYILDKNILSELMQINFSLTQKVEIYSNSIISNNILLPVKPSFNIPNTKEKNYSEHNNKTNIGGHTFPCACAGALSGAFNAIENHLFTQNLDPLDNKLMDLQPIIEDSISQIKKNKINLQKEIDRLKLLVLKTKEYIFKLKKETPLRVEYKSKNR